MESSVMVDWYAKSDESKKILYVDPNNLDGLAISQSLPYDEINFEKNFCLKDILITPDDSDIGYFLKVDLKYTDNIRQKIKNFPFAPEFKNVSKDDFAEHFKKNQTKYLSYA